MISFVVAIGQNKVMGKDNAIPWHIPADLKFFKKVTMGKPIVMGRKTYDSIGRPLPGRLNIVVSRQADLNIPGCVVVDSMEGALEAGAPAPEIMLVGGAQLYRTAMPLVNKIY